jgi:hypothetical protein
MVKDARGGRHVLALTFHSVMATKPRTEEEARACSVRIARARDFLMHAKATGVMTLAGPLTAEEVAEMRGPALESLRSNCRACGLCARFGITPI